MTYQNINSYDVNILDSFEEMSNEELGLAIKISAKSFEIWKRKKVAERSQIVRIAAAMLRLRVDEFARPLMLEMGKLLPQARGEVMLSADILDYYAQNIESFIAPHQRVQPWNLPYYQLACFTAPNLMAGNVVMVKHSECIPKCAIAFEKLWLDAGAPDGSYTNLLISEDQLTQLMDDPLIKGVALTGGIEAGKIVAARAGKNFRKPIIELGSSDAFIVLEDADLDKTIEWASWNKIKNSEQFGVAGKRFIVIESVADKFLSKFQDAVTPANPDIKISKERVSGSLSNEEAILKLLEQVKRALANGAKLLMGGGRIDKDGTFMQHTILTNITPENPAFREEFFGPVALLFRVSNENEAIALANNSQFGLGGSIFTKNLERGKRVAAGIEAGIRYANAAGAAIDLNVTADNNSGFVSEPSRVFIKEFLHKKLINAEMIDAAA
jgi:succinate-semialdehyde dehydrogenase/glutarate-semialdehyde dehydrogenase